MPFRLVRVLVAAIIAEAIPIILPVAAVAVFGPREPAAAQAYAERLGQWIGPIAGSCMCLLAGWWVARSLTGRQVLHGLLIGLMAALIDLSVVVAGAAPFRWIFTASNLGRVLGGALGGSLGSRP